MNGWATQDSPWSNSGAALDTETDVPAWRRPTPFPRNPAYPPAERPYGPVQPAPAQPALAQPALAQPVANQPASGPPVPAPAPPGFVGDKQPGFVGDKQPGFVGDKQPGYDVKQPGLETKTSGEIPPSGDEVPRWAEARPRYSDLLAHLTPPGAEQARPPAPRIAEPGPGETTGAIGREAGLTSRAGLRPAEPVGPGMRGYDLPTPNSAPPYPYEGDLEEPQATPQRAAVPLVRPATPRADWS
ncbi:MAG TPA: hypothetical protein VFW27_09545, partial [Actinoplanes sp.]|nr:hypothetical protein [Actinoplanes sp.]